MYARKQILPDNSYSHVFFRCHNRQFFLKHNHVKNFLILLWAKYKKKYGIEIYEFIIMDNHAHLLLRAHSTEQLGNFMRTVNSQLARYINRTFDRDSQAVRERYKSPLITGTKYAHRVMQYIWLNRHKVNKSKNPFNDPYCSASWRINSRMELCISNKEKNYTLLRNLLDSDDYIYPIEKISKFVRDLINGAMGRNDKFSDSIMMHGHTIGGANVLRRRTELLNKFKMRNSAHPPILH